MHFILYLKIIGEENAVKLIAHHTRTICGMLFEMGTIYFLSIHKWMILFQFSNVENKLFKQPRVCNKRKYLLLLIKYDNFRTERLAFHQTNNISKGVNSTNELNFNSHYEFSFFSETTTRHNSHSKYQKNIFRIHISIESIKNYFNVMISPNFWLNLFILFISTKSFIC